MFVPCSFLWLANDVHSEMANFPFKQDCWFVGSLTCVHVHVCETFKHKIDLLDKSM